jgi:hypothetical protein
MESVVKKDQQRVKRHVISMRVNAEEWDSLLRTMNHLQCRRVSDLMREAFKLVTIPNASLDTAVNGTEKGG